MRFQLALEVWVVISLICLVFEEILDHFHSVYLHVDDTLRLLRRQLVLLNGLYSLVDASGALRLDIVDGVTFRNAMQALHNGGLDQADRSVNVVILDARDEDLFTLLE